MMEVTHLLFATGASGVDNPDLTVCEATQHRASMSVSLSLALWQAFLTLLSL